MSHCLLRLSHLPGENCYRELEVLRKVNCKSSLFINLVNIKQKQENLLQDSMSLKQLLMIENECAKCQYNANKMSITNAYSKWCLQCSHFSLLIWQLLITRMLLQYAEPWTKWWRVWWRTFLREQSISRWWPITLCCRYARVLCVCNQTNSVKLLWPLVVYSYFYIADAGKCFRSGV